MFDFGVKAGEPGVLTCSFPPVPDDDAAEVVSPQC